VDLDVPIYLRETFILKEGISSLVYLRETFILKEGISSLDEHVMASLMDTWNMFSHSL